jgi:CO/xanthine dehydrogenase FAD-binding subunit
MAIIQDMMPAFELFQPASINDALALVNRHGKDAWVMGGGMDSLDWFKDRVKKPKVVVDLGQINELRGIRQQGDGVEIGAMTTLGAASAAVLCAISDALGGVYFNRVPVTCDMILNAAEKRPQSFKPLEVNV